MGLRLRLRVGNASTKNLRCAPRFIGRRFEKVSCFGTVQITISLMSDLAKQVLQQIRTRHLLPDGARVLVAVSGGPDSMALLHLLQRLAVSKSWNLTVAHFNHQLRGRESQQDEELVRDYSRQNRIHAVFGSADVAKLKAKCANSIEMVARGLRHEFLARVAIESDCETVATGHHSDDQVELFFIRLIRGAGTEGLSGMSWMSPSPANPGVRLIRPLLGTSRVEILDYIKKHRVDHHHDSSNQDTKMLRNRIRRSLLPRLRSAGFDIRQQVLETCDILASDSAFIADCARNWKNTPDCNFDALHTALQRSLLKDELIEAGVSPSFRKIEFLRMNPGKRLAVARNKKLARTREGQLTTSSIDNEASPSNAGLEAMQTLVAITPNEGSLRFGAVTFRWRVVPKMTNILSLPRTPHLEMFDADAVGVQIKLRYWRPGDRFQPIGLQKASKLQDLFTNAKWGRSQRHNAVLAESHEGALFWVQGMRISEIFKITPTTKRVLVWEWDTTGQDQPEAP